MDGIDVTRPVPETAGGQNGTRDEQRRWLRVTLPLLVLFPLVAGLLANILLSPGTRARKPLGSLETVQLHGVPVTGCADVCPEYSIDTNFSTRPGNASQFAALVPGRVTEDGPLFVNGYAGTLVDVDGNLLADLTMNDPGLQTVFKRILSGVVADFDNDGKNEILYGLNSYNLFASDEEVRHRQRRSFEMLRAASGTAESYVTVSETAFPMEECPTGGASPCARYYDWRIDGNVTNVVAADFNNDGWQDIAYLGISLGDHSWIGFATELAAAGIPLSNENGARVGIALNRGESEPGVFSWPKEPSAVESYLKGLYPFSNEVDYAPKSHRLLADDFDMDGNVDILVAGEKVVIGWGNGDGGFQSVEEVLDTPGGTDAVAADFDKDGNLDVFILANEEPRYIDLPRVSCVPQPDCAERGRNEGGPSALHLSDGARGYRLFQEFPSLQTPTSVTALDVDGDAWLDVVATCVPCDGPGVLRAQTEDGKLVGFTIEYLAPGEGHTHMRKSAVVDFDLDGRDDILFSGSRDVLRQTWTRKSERKGTGPFAYVLGVGVVAFVVAGFFLLRRVRHPFHR
jgi:hypothetical protein